MPFYIAESDLSGAIMSGTIYQLSPGPTYVSYPDKMLNTVKSSKDGNPIVQAPIRDPRPRTWIWKRYRASVIGYTDLYNKLLNYMYKFRITNLPAKSPWVYVRETETGNLSKIQWNGTKFVEINDWVKVKITDVNQEIAQQGGYAVYESTTLTFYIDDTTYNGF